MDLKLRMLIISGAIFFLLILINMIRKEKLELKYALSWILIDIGVLIMAIWIKLIELIANLIGVITPINAVFFLGIIFILIIIFSLTIAQSRNSKKIKEMAQHIALLENELRK